MSYDEQIVAAEAALEAEQRKLRKAAHAGDDTGPIHAAIAAADRRIVELRAAQAEQTDLAREAAGKAERERIEGAKRRVVQAEDTLVASAARWQVVLAAFATETKTLLEAGVEMSRAATALTNDAPLAYGPRELEYRLSFVLSAAAGKITGRPKEFGRIKLWPAIDPRADANFAAAEARLAKNVVAHALGIEPTPQPPAPEAPRAATLADIEASITATEFPGGSQWPETAA